MHLEQTIFISTDRAYEKSCCNTILTIIHVTSSDKNEPEFYIHLPESFKQNMAAVLFVS